MSETMDDLTPGLDDHLREYVERWQARPAEAIACASTSGITAERAAELISGEGEPWSLIEASDIGMIMGPTPEFWQRLLIICRRANGGDNADAR